LGERVVITGKKTNWLTDITKDGRCKREQWNEKMYDYAPKIPLENQGKREDGSLGIKAERNRIGQGREKPVLRVKR